MVLQFVHMANIKRRFRTPSLVILSYLLSVFGEAYKKFPGMPYLKVDREGKTFVENVQSYVGRIGVNMTPKQQ